MITEFIYKLVNFKHLKIMLIRVEHTTLISPVDWGWPNGQTPRESMLRHFVPPRGRGARTAPSRWSGETLVQTNSFTTLYSARFLRFSQRNWPFPSRLLWTVPTSLPWSILLLSSYLLKIKRKEDSSSSACGHPLQNLTHLLDCLASESLQRTIFCTTFIFGR